MTKPATHLEHPTETSLLIRRSFLGPPALLWSMWTDPAHMARWFGPKGVTCEQTFSTPRVGGEWGCDMRGADGSLHRLRGAYLTLDKPSALSSSWAWLQDDDAAGPESVYNVTFEAEGAGTLLTLSHSLATAEEAQSHAGGWSSALECLAEVLNGA